MATLTLDEKHLLSALEHSALNNDMAEAIELNDALLSANISAAADKKRKRLEKIMSKKRSGFFYRHELMTRIALFALGFVAFSITMVIISTDNLPLHLL